VDGGDGVAIDPNDAHPSRIYERGLRSTLTRLLAANKKVVVVLDEPNLSIEIRPCARAALADPPSQDACKVPAVDVEQRMHAYRQLTLNVLKDFPSVKVADIPSIFCDAQFCWIMKDRRLLYRDSNHLSTTVRYTWATGL
jgi:hypothetical protein